MSTEFDIELIKRVSKNCGSASVKTAPSYLSSLRYWSQEKFFGFTVDGVCFCFGSFAKKHFRLAEIAVEKGRQGEGYGTFMMNMLESECQKRGVHKITLRTSKEETAYRFYMKRGGQVVGEKNGDYEMEFIL